jgi:hypothetical protein
MVGERFCDRIEYLDLNSQMWLNVLVKHQTPNKQLRNNVAKNTNKKIDLKNIYKQHFAL